MFSACDGKSRAQTISATGENFEQGWLSGAKALQRWKNHQVLKTLWLRIDMLDWKKTITWRALQAKFNITKRNYFRFEIMLDKNFNNTILGYKLIAKAILYDGDIGTYHPNTKI